MKLNLMKVILGFAALIVTACQTMPYQPYAREVKRLPGAGGEIALKPEHRDEDRAKAQAMMGSNCGAATVKVTEEGEVVVGQTTNSNARQTHQNAQQGASLGTFLGIPVTSGGRQASNDTSATETTTSLKEWNIKYECDQAVAEAPSPAKRVKK